MRCFAANYNILDQDNINPKVENVSLFYFNKELFMIITFGYAPPNVVYLVRKLMLKATSF